MRKIDAFAHILPAGYLEHLERHLASTMRPDRLRYYQEGVFSFDPIISDLDARRRMMDGYGDYAQVLVLGVPPLEEVDPPQAAVELARRANDEMAELVRGFPEEFVGFAAALPLGDVEASLIEIDRAVGELGALGVQLFTNVRGAPLDDPRFDPILARMEALDRMIWLHPTRDAAWPDYPTERASDFGLWWSLGWPYETAAALARLVYSGQMDRHPRLRLIAHHGGGMVPHFSARLAMGPGHRQTKDMLPLPALDYFHRFYADTALFGAPHAVRCVLEFFGPEHVLFGSDTPLGPPGVIDATIADLDAAGLPEAERAAVYAGNAQRLLGVR
jgi:predicted TIM-barrel fold metal-dependent hydrolase